MGGGGGGEQDWLGGGPAIAIWCLRQQVRVWASAGQRSSQIPRRKPVSDGRDGSLLGDPINRKKYLWKKEKQLFPKEKSKYRWQAFQTCEVEGQPPLPLSLIFGVQDKLWKGYDKTLQVLPAMTWMNWDRSIWGFLRESGALAVPCASLDLNHMPVFHRYYETWRGKSNWGWQLMHQYKTNKKSTDHHSKKWNISDWTWATKLSGFGSAFLASLGPVPQSRITEFRPIHTYKKFKKNYNYKYII